MGHFRHLDGRDATPGSNARGLPPTAAPLSAAVQDLWRSVWNRQVRPLPVRMDWPAVCAEQAGLIAFGELTYSGCAAPSGCQADTPGLPT